jgi:diguanylate cyclase (GGDEF)-like protein/PAS domain S-box-containing protein
LGFTTWYPATGLNFALLFGISPWYAILMCCSDFLASALIYHQPLFSWSTLAAVFITTIYATAAVLLRGRFRIDPNLSRRLDVLRYTVVTMIAALAATAAGIGGLLLDHTIAVADYPRSAMGWFVGDEVALLAFAPFLLIHVVPWVRRQLASNSALPPHLPTKAWSLMSLSEAIAQALSIAAILWIMFGRTFAPYELFYLCFTPIIWVAVRNGISRAVIAILALDFGIVIALHFFPAAPDVVAKIGLLMLVVSATGLVVGSAVTERQLIKRELRQRSVYLDSLVENSPLGIVALDRAGNVELCNRAFEDLFGFHRTELAGRPFDSVVGTGEHDHPLELSPEVYAGKSVQAITQRKRNDGVLIDVNVHAVPLIIDDEVRGSYALYEDISGTVKAAEEKNRQQNVLKSLVDQLQSRTEEMTLLIELSDLLQCCGSLEEAYAVIARMGPRLFSRRSSGCLSVFKSSRNALELVTTWGLPFNTLPTFTPGGCWALRRGKPHWSKASPTGLVCAHLKDQLHTDHGLCIPMVAQGDTIGVLQLQVSAAPDSTISDENMESALERIASSAAGQIAMSIASLKLRDVLKDQSIRDPLTGLYNRRFMQEYLDGELPRARRTNRAFTIAFIDLDHFKRFNDSFGHDAGDLVLQVFAKTLKDFFRQSDILCRFGGEEFAVVLLDCPLPQAEIRINVLRDEVRKITLTHRNIKMGSVTFSTGLAAFPIHGSSAEELFHTADLCLYESKKQGRDRVTIPTEVTS